MKIYCPYCKELSKEILYDDHDMRDLNTLYWCEKCEKHFCIRSGDILDDWLEEYAEFDIEDIPKSMNSEVTK